jgi:ligand-binding sensor domain-containing protein
MLKHIRLVSTLSLLLVLLAACAPGVGIFASGNWQSGGLPHQHIRALAVDPNNAQNIYAGDTQDGVYISLDGGMHWQRRSAGLPPTTALNALAFNDSGKTLYAATGSGIYSSTDAARSWTQVSGLPADTYTSLAFDLKSPQVIFAGTLHHGLLSSSNAGSTWRASGTGLSMAINNLVFDSNTGRLWAATDQGVYLSVNHGLSWQALNNGLPAGASINAVLPASLNGGSADLVYAGTSRGFYLSQDHGQHWTSSKTPLVRVSVLAISLDVQNTSTVYIATDKAGVLRSSDNGQDWISVATGLPAGQPVYDVTQGAANYGQLFAAANDVYLYPGTSSVLDPARLIPLLLGVIFFYILYRMTTRRLRRTHEMLEPHSPPEPHATGPGESRENPVNSPSDQADSL